MGPATPIKKKLKAGKRKPKDNGYVEYICDQITPGIPDPFTPPPTMHSSPLSEATPPSGRNKVSVLRLIQYPEIPHRDDDPNPSSVSPHLHKRRQLKFRSESYVADHLPLRELILLSPTQTPKSVVVDTENIDPESASRRSKSKSLMRRSSPRSTRRPRRNSNKASREERELGFLEEDMVKNRRPKRQNRKAVVKETSSLAPVAVPRANDQPPRRSETLGDDGDGICLQGVGHYVSELVMWKDVARTSLWFGLGSLYYFTSCFSRTLRFDFMSAISHVGLFTLALAFFYDSFSQRWEEQRRPRYRLKEEDVLRVVQLIQPTANAAIAVLQELFSGEPLTTLKVAPVLLFIANYSHLITIRRLLAAGFFISFTVPKLFCCYSNKIQKHVESIKRHLFEACKACPHKRFMALTCGTMFWNLFGVRMRIVAAFLAAVILRYLRQRTCTREELDGVEVQGIEEVEKEQSVLVKVKEVSTKEA